MRVGARDARLCRYMFHYYLRLTLAEGVERMCREISTQLIDANFKLGDRLDGARR